jgi:hypothetical protein
MVIVSDGELPFQLWNSSKLENGCDWGNSGEMIAAGPIVLQASHQRRIPDIHTPYTGKPQLVDRVRAKLLILKSAPVAQLDRASDFESLPAVLQFLTKIRKQFNLGCLASFRATPLKSFCPKK